jgi:hypothetical protein
MKKFNHETPGAALAATKVAQTSKSAVSRVSQPARPTASEALPIWKSATQQVWKPALSQGVVFLRSKYLRRKTILFEIVARITRKSFFFSCVSCISWFEMNLHGSIRTKN